jgi:hypothetical protein
MGVSLIGEQVFRQLPRDGAQLAGQVTPQRIRDGKSNGRALLT